MNSNRPDGDDLGRAMSTGSSGSAGSMGTSSTGTGGISSNTAASGSGANVARGMSGDTQVSAESSGLSPERLREQTQQASQWAREQASQLGGRASELGDQASRWAEDAKVTAQQRLDELSGRVREKPIGAVAAAAGIGLIIGLLLGR